MLLLVPFRAGILIIMGTKYYSEVETDVRIEGMADGLVPNFAFFPDARNDSYQETRSNGQLMNIKLK